jgi:hypothetical protein
MDQLERVRSHRRMFIAGCVIVAIGTCAVAAADGRAAVTPEAFAVSVGAPEVTTIDLGAPGKTPGDLYAVEAPVFDGSGAAIGRLVASQTSIRLEHRAETVLVSGTFELRDGTIVIGGLSLYPREGTGNVPGRSFVRPVIGGTGRYAGVGGTVTTVRGSDGRYQQRFSLTGVPNPTQRMIVHSPGGTGARIDLGTPGASRGDVTAVTAPLVDARDAAIGNVRGIQTTVDVEGQATEVHGGFTYELLDGQIAVSGVSAVPPQGGGLAPATPFARAVVGGTGRYAGRAGTAVSTRSATGGYDTTFDLQPRQQLTRKLRLTSGPGTFAAVDLAPTGPSAADLTVFGSIMRDRHGHRAGRSRGVQTTIVQEGGAVVVQANITYDLRGGQLVVGGLSRYPIDGNRPIRGRTFVRPVLGGTGRYAGARGTMITRTRPDGSFRQVFRLTE